MSALDNRPYSRGVNSGDVKLKDPLGNIVKTKEERILQLYGVNDSIRIPKRDYPESSKAGVVFVHYNLPIEYSREGFSVVLPKIIRRGYFKKPNIERLPILSFDGVWKAKVVNFVRHTNYSDLAPYCLKNVIGGAKDVDGLKKMMTRRYLNVLGDETEEGIINKGVTVTFLRFEELVSG